MSPQEAAMKAIKTSLILALAALVSACATVSTSQSEPTERFDSAYTHAVEDAARNSAGGLDVIWINPPTAKESSEDSGSR